MDGKHVLLNLTDTWEVSLHVDPQLHLWHYLSTCDWHISKAALCLFGWRKCWYNFRVQKRGLKFIFWNLPALLEAKVSTGLQQFLTVSDLYRSDKAAAYIHTSRGEQREVYNNCKTKRRRNKARREKGNPAFPSVACPALLVLYKSPTEAAVKVADLFPTRLVNNKRCLWNRKCQATGTSCRGELCLPP